MYYEYRNSLRVSFIRVTPFVRQWTDIEVSLLPLKGTGEDKSFVFDLEGDMAMKTMFLFLLMAIVVVACSSATQEPPTILPEPTHPPEPTVTATEPVETELPPLPSATNTP